MKVSYFTSLAVIIFFCVQARIPRVESNSDMPSSITKIDAPANQDFGAYPSKRIDIEFYKPHADGQTDDTAILQSALNKAASSGSYSVVLGPHQYLIDTASLTVPTDVHLDCVGSVMGENENNQDYSTLPCTLKINPAYTIVLNERSSIDHVSVINKNYDHPKNMRAAIMMVRNFSGTGITVNGGDVHIKHANVLGFALCVLDNGRQREVIDYLYGDCTSGLYLSQIHDIARWEHVHLWPFLTTHNSWSANGAFAVLGLANNGEGLVRVTFAAGMEPAVTGDKMWLSAVQGLPYSFRGGWDVTVVDNTHVDLQGSAWPDAGNISVTTAVGSTSATSRTPNITNLIGPGMLLNGQGLAAGTTVAAVYENIVILSKAAIGTGSESIVGFKPAAGIGGGQIAVDLNYRAGTAFHWDNGEHNTCSHCFELGHEIGFDIGPFAGWTEVDDGATDGGGVNGYTTESRTSSAILIGNTSFDTIISGGWYGGKAHVLEMREQSGSPSVKITGSSLNVNGLYAPALNLLAGNLIITGTTLSGNGTTTDIANRGSIWIGNQQGKIIFVGNNLGFAKFQAENAAAAARLTQLGNISGGGP